LLVDALGLSMPSEERLMLLRDVAQPDSSPSELKMIEYFIQALFIIYLQYFKVCSRDKAGIGPRFDN
jgi:hypothetical protein